VLAARYCLLNFRDDLGTTLPGYFEYNPRLLLVTGNRVTGEQQAIERMFNPGCLLNRLAGGRVEGDLTSQSTVIPGSDFNKYLHPRHLELYARPPRRARLRAAFRAAAERSFLPLVNAARVAAVER